MANLKFANEPSVLAFALFCIVANLFFGSIYPLWVYSRFEIKSITASECATKLIKFIVFEISFGLLNVFFLLTHGFILNGLLFGAVVVVVCFDYGLLTGDIIMKENDVQAQKKRRVAVATVKLIVGVLAAITMLIYLMLWHHHINHHVPRQREINRKVQNLPDHLVDQHHRGQYLEAMADARKFIENHPRRSEIHEWKS